MRGLLPPLAAALLIPLLAPAAQADVCYRVSPPHVESSDTCGDEHDGAIYLWLGPAGPGVGVDYEVTSCSADLVVMTRGGQASASFSACRDLQP